MNFSVWDIHKELEHKYKDLKYKVKGKDRIQNASFHFLDNCLTDEDIIKNKLLNCEFDIFNEIEILIDVKKFKAYVKFDITPTYKNDNKYYDFKILFNFANLNIFANKNKIFKYIESAHKVISNLSITDKELIKCFKKNKSLLMKNINTNALYNFDDVKNIFYEKIKQYNLITKDNITDFLNIAFNQKYKGYILNHSIEGDVYSFLFSLIIKEKIIWNS